MNLLRFWKIEILQNFLKLFLDSSASTVSCYNLYFRFRNLIQTCLSGKKNFTQSIPKITNKNIIQITEIFYSVK